MVCVMVCVCVCVCVCAECMYMYGMCAYIHTWLVVCVLCCMLACLTNVQSNQCDPQIIFIRK